MSDIALFDDLPRGCFGAVIVDPPWPFEAFSAKGLGRSAVRHYGVMVHADIRSMPIASLCLPDAAIACWVPQHLVHIAIEVLAAWGFNFKTAGAWAKRSRTGRCWAFGCGKILRSAAEFFIVGTRGHPRVLSHGERNLIIAPVREHSRKPDELHAMIERLYAGPYCELFARRHYPGWNCWGDELAKSAVANSEIPKLEEAPASMAPAGVK
jgi:N6-adenosine-specific RNA methylase IME4